MLSLDSSAHQTPFSPLRARLRQRLRLFSIISALIVLFLAGLLFTIMEVYIPLQSLRETNQKAFDRIPCDATACDVSEIANSWESAWPDYLLHRDTYFLLNVEMPTAGFSGFPLHYSDLSFANQFQTPASVQTPAGESWRLYSAIDHLGSKPAAVVVGYAERVSWKADIPAAPTVLIDQELKRQLSDIERAVREPNVSREFLIPKLEKIALDGYEIVDISSGEILAGGYWIPVYLPRSRPLPSKGFRLYTNKRDLYLIRTDIGEHLLAVSTYHIGEWPSLVALFGILFFISFVVAHFSANRFLRKYFALRQTQSCSVEEALRLGEGPSIEFKRNIAFESPSSTEEMLQTITAFANTGDGTIFVGVDDTGKITGIQMDRLKEKDRFSHRLHQIVRDRIKPAPVIQVSFKDIRTLTTSSVFVPRGEEPLYFLDGVIYVRDGSSDIKAQPAIVKRILTEHIV
jgi:schlafen family protein